MNFYSTPSLDFKTVSHIRRRSRGNRRQWLSRLVISKDFQGRLPIDKKEIETGWLCKRVGPIDWFRNDASLTARLYLGRHHFRPLNPTIFCREIVLVTRVSAHGPPTCCPSRRVSQRDSTSEPSTAPRGLRQQLCTFTFRIDSLTARSIKAKTHNASRRRNLHCRNTIKPYLYHAPVDSSLTEPRGNSLTFCK